MGCARTPCLARRVWLGRRELSRLPLFRLACVVHQPLVAHCHPLATHFLPLPPSQTPYNTHTHTHASLHHHVHHHNHLNHHTSPLSSSHPRITAAMSSPSKRSTRSTATPGRATRSSQQRSSPAPGPSNAAAAARTPRQTRASQLASSPLFYQSSSSPAPSGNRASSPLRQQTETQSTGDRTPRASGVLMGGMISSRHRCIFTLPRDCLILTDYALRLLPHPLRPQLQPRPPAHPAVRHPQRQQRPFCRLPEIHQPPLPPRRHQP